MATDEEGPGNSQRPQAAEKDGDADALDSGELVTHESLPPEPDDRIARVSKRLDLEGRAAALVGNHADVARLAMEQSRLIDRFTKAVQPFAASAVIDQFKAADFLVPLGLRNLELAGTARLAELMGANSAVATWRQSLVTAEIASSLASASHLRFEQIGASLLSDLTRLSTAGASLTETAMHLSESSAFASSLIHPPTFQLQHYLAALPEPASIREIALGAKASYGIAGLVSAEVASTAPNEFFDLDNAVEQIDGDVIRPWLEGPEQVRQQMLDQLERLDEGLPELLHGAWDELNRNGPAANVKIATCTVEVLERTLRALAPNDDVLAWHESNHRPASELDGNGRPTIRARVGFVLRNHPSEKKLVMSQVDAVLAQVPELRSRLEASKHSSSGSSIALKAHLVSAEALLVQLTIER